jgi:16S rRNA (cytosine967-C5)-methyltransferase
MALLEANNRPPHLSCTLVDTAQTAQVTQSLRDDGFEVQPGRWLTTALRISGRNPAEARALKLGQASVQDEASQMVARLLDARAGELVLDLCAAPGGKTAILARAVAPSGAVIAADVHEHRLRAAREQIQKTHTAGVRWLALDATQPLPLVAQFPRILLDAPCSGTGTLARNPEIRWRLQPEDLTKAHCRQTAMLRQALGSLKRGGRLVYATCSVEPEENEQVVREVISQQTGVHIADGEETLRPSLRAGADIKDLFDANRFFRTFPPESGTDGFFAAVLQRD